MLVNPEVIIDTSVIYEEQLLIVLLSYRPHHLLILCNNTMFHFILNIIVNSNHRLSLLVSRPLYCHRHSNHRGRGYSHTPALVGYYQTCCPGICHRVCNLGPSRRLLQLDHFLHSLQLLHSLYHPTLTHHLTHLLHSPPLPHTSLSEPYLLSLRSPRLSIYHIQVWLPYLKFHRYQIMLEQFDRRWGMDRLMSIHLTIRQLGTSVSSPSPGIYF